MIYIKKYFDSKHFFGFCGLDGTFDLIKALITLIQWITSVDSFNPQTVRLACRLSGCSIIGNEHIIDDEIAAGVGDRELDASRAGLVGGECEGLVSGVLA